MRILNNQRRYAAVLEQFGKEDLDRWPDDSKSDASSIRALAAYRQNNGALAVSDALRAIRYEMSHPSKSSLLNSLGDTYRNLLKDDAKALAAYRLAIDITTYSSRKSQAAISAANILLNQGKPQDALEELAKVQVADGRGNPWDANLLRSRASVLATLNRTAEAVAAYQRVLAMDGAPDNVKEACRASIEAMGQ